MTLRRSAPKQYFGFAGDDRGVFSIRRIAFRRRNVIPADISLLLLGAMINTASYLSITPFLIAVGIYTTSWIVLSNNKLGGYPEWRMFSRVFGVCFVMAGVGAVYANQLGDAGQLLSDAAGFFKMAASDENRLSIVEIERLSEGSLAIWIWRTAYNFFYYIGFEKLPYIGISVNATAVALSGVFGIKMTRLVFGEDTYRFQQLTLLVASCGLLWLVAALHLRDALVLLMVTMIFYAWLSFVSRPTIGWRLIGLVIISLASASAFTYLRREFTFIPVALMTAAIASVLIAKTPNRQDKTTSINIIYLGKSIGIGVLLITGIGIFFTFGEGLLLALKKGAETYSAVSEETGAGGLGYSMIVNQPLPIKLLLGGAYLFVFPIPVWSGLQLESAYHMFKSLNAPFFYALIPMLFMATWKIISDEKFRSRNIVFLLIASIGFIMAITVTSLETRHLSPFLLPIFVLALVPDFHDPTVWVSYKKLLSLTIFIVISGHLAWSWLKI